MPRLFTNICLLAVLAAGTSHAGIMLTAVITNAQEVPTPTLTTATGAARPASFGTASFFVNDAMTSMTFTATIFNIDFGARLGTPQTADTNDDLVNAHIHASATVVPGGTAPVVWGFVGSPFNDNNPPDVVYTPFTTGVGGTVSGKWDLPEGNGTGVTLATELPFILTGHSYINFHTVQNTGGETRGFLEVVPEPTSLVLFGSGSVVLLAVRWRRRRRARAV